MRRTLLIILMALMAVVAWAQQLSEVSGTVVSQSTGQPVAGANISGGGHAVVANDDGYFVLKTETKPDHITVSHVGYRSQRIDIGSMPKDPLKIRLQPTTIQLNEVLVVAYDPHELMANAIRKIPDNYSRQPELLHCFYRETAMKRQHHILVAEGVVDMYKTAYGTGVGRDRVAIRKGRRLLSPRHSDTLSVKVMGGPIVPVQLDLVKNLQFLLNEEELSYYSMAMEAPAIIADREQLVVAIHPKVAMPYALYHGRFYIDRETLAFTRAELTLDVSDREKATTLMLVKKPAGVRFRPKELSLLVDYRQEQGVTRISYVRSTFRFNCDWRRRLFATAFTAFCEMVVTSHTNGPDAVPIKGRDSFDQRDAFFDKVDYFRDSTFWQDYNIIEPTERLDKAINRLMKR